MSNIGPFSPLDPLGLFEKSWPTSIIPFRVDIEDYVVAASGSAGQSVNSDIFLFIPSDLAIDRVFFYLTGPVGTGTGSLSLQLVQALADGAVAEVTDVVTLGKLSDRDIEVRSPIELLGSEVMAVGWPVYLRVLGSQPVDTSASNAWFANIWILGSVHFVATFNFNVKTVPQESEDRISNGIRQY